MPTWYTLVKCYLLCVHFICVIYLEEWFTIPNCFFLVEAPIDANLTFSSIRSRSVPQCLNIPMTDQDINSLWNHFVPNFELSSVALFSRRSEPQNKAQAFNSGLIDGFHTGMITSVWLLSQSFPYTKRRLKATTWQWDLIMKLLLCNLLNHCSLRETLPFCRYTLCSWFWSTLFQYQNLLVGCDNFDPIIQINVWL